MITIKSSAALEKMAKAGKHIADIFDMLHQVIKPGVSAAFIDQFVDAQLIARGLVSMTKGYKGFKHASCVSINDEVVHGIPKLETIVQEGDLVSVDICASWQGYCADAARTYYVSMSVNEKIEQFIAVAQKSLNAGIAKMRVGNRLTDVSAAIQKVIEEHGYGIVRDFAGHGIGASMHEDPDVLNYGVSGKGPILRSGMVFAIEPMITMGDHRVYVDDDGWTARTVDGSLAVHVEDTVAITDCGPRILTRKNMQ